MSAADIDKGARWFDQVEAALEEANGRGIFCLTPENLDSRWLNFEAGVVASRGGKARVCSLLLAMNQEGVPPPLSLFQLTPATQDDILQLLKSLNKDCARPVADRVLERAFEANWPELFAALTSAAQMPVGPEAAARPPGDKLAEVLGIVRRIEQTTSTQAANLRRMVRQGTSERWYLRDLASSERLSPARRNKLLEAMGSDAASDEQAPPNALASLLNWTVPLQSSRDRDPDEKT